MIERIFASAPTQPIPHHPPNHRTPQPRSAHQLCGQFCGGAGWLSGSIVGSFNNGQFVSNGSAIIAGRKYDYIVKSDGQIIVGQKHTFMSQGDDVLAAGKIKFNGGGFPVDINNLSGHYQPTPGEAMNFLRAFQQQGVATDNIFLSMYNANGTIFRQIHPNANARILYHQ